MLPRQLPRAAFYALFTASGFAGLIYESIWTHYLKLFLGHAAYAQSLVLVVFMGGMAAGSALAGARSQRIANPLLGYAAAEAVVGLLALAFHAVFGTVTDWAYASLLPAMPGEYAVHAAKLVVAALLILPQAMLLGMTFPLMSTGLVRAHPTAGGESVAMLYFTNSLGAAVGVLASGFVLIGWVGLPGTLQVAGVINLVQVAAQQLAGTNVRVNAVCPGLIETGMTKPIYDMARAAGREDKIGQLNPLKRGGEPHEIGNVVLFLASDAASYVNGQFLAVDGGLTSSLPVAPRPLPSTMSSAS